MKLKTPILAFSLFFVAFGLPQKRPKFDWNRIKFVHSFGDSYSFVQGTQGNANFSFIGDALDFSFTPSQLLTDEIIPRNVSEPNFQPLY